MTSASLHLDPVLDLVRELGVSIVRYPGGNVVSGYRWEDGIAPAADRPVRGDLAWHTLETNAVGIDEFTRWATKADVEIMYSFNLGTRGVQDALDAHEYINHPKYAALSDQRRTNGADQPYDVRLFCLGNEMHGPRESEVLELAYDHVDHISAHAHDHVDHISAHARDEELDGDLGSFLASGVNMDHVIDSVVATADAVGARLKSSKKVTISFDKWNVGHLGVSRPGPGPERRSAGLAFAGSQPSRP